MSKNCTVVKLISCLVYYNKNVLMSIRILEIFGHTEDIETVALLSTQKCDRHIDIEITTDELDLTSSEAKATYQQIKDYIQKEWGIKVSSLSIAQVKREYGIIERENYNFGKEGHKVPQVSEEKRKIIIDALRYFKMI